MGQSPSLQSVIFLPAIESSIIAVMELLRRWSWQSEGVNNGCAKGWRCSQAFLFILSGVERGQISTHWMGENGMNLCNWFQFVFRVWCVLIISRSKKRGEKLKFVLEEHDVLLVYCLESLSQGHVQCHLQNVHFLSGIWVFTSKFMQYH